MKSFDELASTYNDELVSSYEDALNQAKSKLPDAYTYPYDRIKIPVFHENLVRNNLFDNQIFYFEFQKVKIVTIGWERTVNAHWQLVTR